MKRTAVVVIGAGQAGLAVSYQLTAAAIDHVVLERHRTASAWTSQRWDSLRLLTPNWMSRLPGWSYHGDDPGGFMKASEVAGFLGDYAQSFGAPVITEADVLSVSRRGGAYLVVSEAGAWRTDAVVIATGYCAQSAGPRIATNLDASITQFTPDRYHNPDDVPAGGVLVVGASATGVQLADELAGAGHDVLLAVGRHARLPRRYRGMDIMWWLDTIGALDRPVEGADAAALAEPSLQLVAGRDDTWLDLSALSHRGVQLAGRLTGVDGTLASLADDLAQTTARADLSLNRLLDRIDTYATTAGLDAELDPPIRPEPSTPLSGMRVSERLDLRLHGIRSVLWATGCRRDYSWLHVRVLDDAGEVVHAKGLTRLPGVVVVGMRWQSRRKSTLIDGVRHDAALIVEHLITTVLSRPADRWSAA